MSYIVGTVVAFNYCGKKKYGVIDVIKSDALWLNQISYKGGYVCKVEDVIKKYNIGVDEFIEQYPERRI